MIGDSFARVERALDLRRCVPGSFDRNGMALCPAHDDQNPSLHVTHKDDRTLLHCFAGCDTEDILLALGLEPGDLFDEELVK